MRAFIEKKHRIQSLSNFPKTTTKHKLLFQPETEASEMGKHQRSTSEQPVLVDVFVPDITQRRLTEGDVMRTVTKRGSNGMLRKPRMSIGTLVKELEKNKPKPRLLNIALKAESRRKVEYLRYKTCCFFL